MKPGNPLSSDSQPVPFLAGAGDMAMRIREYDWSSTSLGPPSAWPQSLRSAVSILLPSRAQICLFWGPDLIAIYNDAYRPALGVKHPWALGRPAREVWSEFWADVLRPLLEGVLETGDALWATDHPFFLERHGYSEETFFDISYDPVRDESGGVGGVFCIVSETTGRVVGERRLRTLRDLSAVASEAKTVDDAFREAARVLSANPQDVPFALLFDMSEGIPARGIAAGAVEQTASDLWPLSEAMTGEVLLSGETLASKGPLPGGPWPESPREVLVLPISIPGHEAVGVLVAGISPRRALDDGYRTFLQLAASHIAETAGAVRALQQERARAEALAEIDRAKSVFFSNVSHEFRTPLTLMLAPLEELLGKPGLEGSDHERDLISVAHRNARRLLKLVNALLEFSRIEAGKMQLSRELLSLGPYTVELASGFQSAMDHAGLDFQVDCSRFDDHAYVDRDAWEGIVQNLISNAFKFTLQGFVRVTLEGRDGHVILSVADSGCGIPEHELPNMFKRFHRIQAMHSRTHEGTGIGLALVQELVKLHGGTLTVESREGEGSTFRVAIPLGHHHLPANADAMAASRSKRPRHPSPILEEVHGWLPAGDAARAPREPESAVRGHIVLADDNRDMLDYIRRLLEQDGYVVTTASDGAAALEAIERRRPDLLITDVMMPVMDGFALLKAVRSHPTLNDVAVVMLSARAGEEAKVTGLEAGADDYLVKPFSATELKARVGANIGISRLRRASAEREHALRLEAESERDRLHAVLSGIRDNFVVLDDEWKFVFVSDSWCTLTGVSRESAMGRTVWELFPAVIGTDWEATARRVMESRQPASFEYWYEPYGAWFDLRMSPWPEGGISQLSLDITERRQAEIERGHLLDSERAARAEAERATRMKDDFLATLSHELRTPLHSISGWIHLLKQAPNDPALMRQGMEVIERNTRLQTEMISDLLDLNRIIAGKMRMDVRPVALPEVVNAAIAALAPTAQAKGVRLQAVVEPIVDPIHGDASRIQQIVWNLLSNAIKFTPSGGRVQVVLARVNSHVEITVSDTGQGISSDALQHLFQRFWQADAGAARRHGGLGIGLALVKLLTELHGGRVRAHSDGEGKGATFVIELPLAIFKENSQTTREHPRAPLIRRDGSGAPDLAGLRVLLIDDDLESLEVVKRLLEDCGASVILADSARAAETHLEQESFDVILSDIGLPRRDGYQLMAEVRSRGIKTPAIALTAFARTEDRTKALMSGFQAHIAKPVDPAELLATLGALSGRSPVPSESGPER